MILGKCSVHNFGSYRHLEFDFSDLGLALAYGKTGSGKSTIPDMPSWILYGVTSKNGTADEVRSWMCGGDTTVGVLDVILSDGAIKVTRVRGKPAQNDLYWTEGNSSVKLRGKDIPDTQKRLEERLRVPREAFITGSYFHEFSPTAGFFTSKAKERRALFEGIASMDLALRLSEGAASQRKDTKALLTKRTSELARLAGKLEELGKSEMSAIKYSEGWVKKHEDRLIELKTMAENFDTIKLSKIGACQTKYEAWETNRSDKLYKLRGQLKAKADKIVPPYFEIEIKSLNESARCLECNALLPKIQAKIQKLIALKNENEANIVAVEMQHKLIDMCSAATNPHLAELDAAKSQSNTYQDQYWVEHQAVNPFTDQISKIVNDAKAARSAVLDKDRDVKELESLVSDLTTLYDLSFDLRGELLKKSVFEIQEATNGILETYFDSEIRVGFTIEGSDALEVAIQKSGYDCSYTQLSKGQRQLLKLAFGISVMQATANRAGVHFDCMFLDEPTDGMDADLKVKSFALLEKLASECTSVLVIEHSSELQNMFSTKYHVTMDSDSSSLELVSE
jgi:DNA repair exonuclease SbcCD ATPase subunit